MPPNFSYMRKPAYILCFLLAAASLPAQNHDYYWPFGYASYDTLPEIGGSAIDFNHDPPDVFAQDREMNFDFTCASICDTAGNLLFYTNGEYIANYLHEKIPGSDTLSPGTLFNNVTPKGYRIIQGAVILPSPRENEQNIFYLFHQVGEYGTQFLSIHSSGLYSTVVDMDMNNGTGGIFSKRDTVIQDTLLRGKMSAVKHANGRDWWLIATEHASNRFYKVLLDTSGVQVVGNQAVGAPVHPWEGVGQVAFSPDGSKYARFNAISLAHGADLDIYDFDRCTGTLGNPLHLSIQDSCYGGGVAFSPSSRFLYVVSTFFVYQFDMWADDVLASKTTVAVFDGFTDPFPTWFFLAQLGPDGKIYINTRSASMHMHVIHNPDEPGDACNVEQHAIQLPTYNAWTMPNFPHYRLGAIPPITPSFMYSVSNDTVFFQNTSTGGVKHAWDFGDGATAQGRTVQHVYGQPGAYPVTLTVSEGCFSESVTDTVWAVFTGTREGEEAEKGVRVFPNPATAQVQVLLPPGTEPALVTLTDLMGREVARSAVPPGQELLLLDVSHLPPGIYYLSAGPGRRPAKLTVAR